MGLFSFFSAPKAPLPPLRFYNTLSQRVEDFVAHDKVVKMYNCGPTVYDRQHVGNLRPYVFADTLRRTLEAWGHSVRQVVNITDVGHLTSDADEGEDKLEKSAQAHGRHAQEIAQEVTQGWFDDLDTLYIDRSKIEFPRATEYIEEQLALVKTLYEKGYGYKITDGLYFDTAKFEGYGKLGRIALRGQEAGARVEENKEKKNPQDFALWKFSQPTGKREQEWDSPWGVGFPGWHIECTAMIFKLLGKQIDIHTGGVDHIPVHHNNEIAQAESLTAKQYVRYWMHNEFITIDGKKISKSLGNTVYLGDFAARGLSPRALRYWFLTSHYRTPANFTWDALEGASQAYMRLVRLYQELPPSHLPPHQPFLDTFYAAIADDLGTPQALAALWDMVRDETISPAVKKVSLAEADTILGLGLTEVQPRYDVPPHVQQLAAEREAARKAKDFARSDELRTQIEAAGFEVKDTPQGPRLMQK